MNFCIGFNTTILNQRDFRGIKSYLSVYIYTLDFSRINII